MSAGSIRICRDGFLRTLPSDLAARRAAPVRAGRILRGAPEQALATRGSSVQLLPPSALIRLARYESVNDSNMAAARRRRTGAYGSMAFGARSGQGRLVRFALASAWRRLALCLPCRLVLSLALLRPGSRAAADRADGSAHRRPDHRPRYLCRPLRLCRRGGRRFWLLGLRDRGAVARPGPPALHGFGWLRHLRASDLAVSRSNARALVDEWVRFQKSHDPVARDPEVMARRIISWLAQTPLVLEGCDHGFYRRFMRVPDPAGAAAAAGRA